MKREGERGQRLTRKEDAEKWGVEAVKEKGKVGERGGGSSGEEKRKEKWSGKMWMVAEKTKEKGLKTTLITSLQLYKAFFLLSALKKSFLGPSNRRQFFFFFSKIQGSSVHQKLSIPASGLTKSGLPKM